MKKYPDIMLSVKDMLIGYHITPSENRKSIQLNGLIPNGNEDKMVRNASQLIDLDRPNKIPKQIIREYSNYAWPVLTNYCIGQKNINEDLYVVYISKPERCWVGSQGIGGFCLIDYESNAEQYVEKIKRKYTKTYWTASCSLDQFITYNDSVKRKDNYYGLDEILLSYQVDPRDLILIGHWDEKGFFHEECYFKNYVKPEFKYNYRKILRKYKEN
jgi:hypothetical protein